MATNSTPDHALAMGNAPTPPHGPVANRQPTQGSASGESRVLCGPLLNYRYMTGANTPSPVWHGSVLIVTTPKLNATPELHLQCTGSVSSFGGSNGAAPSTQGSRTFQGERLYEDPKKAFWRFSIDLPFQSFEARWEYVIPNIKPLPGADGQPGEKRTFYVPSSAESMRIMFHSCNGFSVGTDEDSFNGPNLWKDVLRKHKEKPFHLMIGGGDQIYNDSIRISGPLRPWTDEKNPKKRRDYPFPEQLRADCDEYYFNNYVRWYSMQPFAGANGSIAQINIWDDHDIIDGFGSYTDHFMRCAIFRGLGGVAQKYYLLFQHHNAPPRTTFTSDAPETAHGGDDPRQTEGVYVLTEKTLDPCFLVGPKPGPYVEQHSRSIYCQLGAHVAFLGLDARTERTRHQVNYPETYEMIFNHVTKEIAASNGNIKHLILLLGVPIAYPRLAWLENLLRSPIIGPIRLLNKRFGIAGGLFNTFDGGVDLLDDLDDHYTAHAHKKERRELVQQLQRLSKDMAIRISILGGDVHLAALGRFYSKPELGIPAEKDFRYMPNIVSSAITNKPPPAAVANLLARRNKIHHLDHETDETLLNFFDKDPGSTDSGKHLPAKTNSSNHATMPSRNFAIIAESHRHGGGAAPAATANGQAGDAPRKITNPRDPLHAGEEGCGTAHPAASGMKETGLGGQWGLDVSICVEIDQHDIEAKTQGYGFSIPALEV